MERGSPLLRFSLSRIFAVILIIYTGVAIFINHLSLQLLDVYSDSEGSPFGYGIKNHDTLYHGSLQKQPNVASFAKDNAILPNFTMRELAEMRNKTKDIDRPSIVWLMSYPNSGTSFTMSLVALDSNRTIASNYPEEATDIGFEVESLYRESTVPFFVRSDLPLPSKYIITKTHCGGRCLTCPAKQYANFKLSAFLLECGYSRNVDYGYYDEYARRRVKKAIHLMRNPISNCVSNFHHLRTIFKLENKTGLLRLFSNDKAGFNQFCEVSELSLLNVMWQVFLLSSCRQNMTTLTEVFRTFTYAA